MAEQEKGGFELFGHDMCLPPTGPLKLYTFDKEDPDNAHDITVADFFKKHPRCVVFAIPGAYTSVCTKDHCPTFVTNIAKFKAQNVEVACLAANDIFVLQQFAKDTGMDKAGIMMLSDPQAHFASTIGKVMEPHDMLGTRVKRFAMFVDNCRVKAVTQGGVEMTGAEGIMKELYDKMSDHDKQEWDANAKKGFLQQGLDKAKEMYSSLKSSVEDAKESMRQEKPEGKEQEDYPDKFERQAQYKHPGVEADMKDAPMFKAEWYKGTGKLRDQVAIITGGDSGIGRSVAVLYAREGARVTIVYLSDDEAKDAQETKRVIEEEENSECLLLQADVGKHKNAKKIVSETLDKYGRIDILVNNAGYQRAAQKLEDIPQEQIRRTFDTNIFGTIYLTQAVLPFMRQRKSGCIINTTSVNNYDPMPELLDYDATKGAITAFSRALSKQVAKDHIRVNCVAPGPIWTPLIPSSFGQDLPHGKQMMKTFGKEMTLLKRAGQPEEVATAFVFLASKDGNYFTGQTLHPNGGMFVHT